MTYIYTRVDVEAFRDALRPFGGFSHGALRALFDYLSDSGPLELDPIALCGEWSEFDSALCAAKGYGYDGADDGAALMWLLDRTAVVAFGHGILVSAF